MAVVTLALIAASGFVQNARGINGKSGYKSGSQIFYYSLIHKCHCCKTGTLVTIDVFGKRGPPQHYFTGQQNAPDA